MLVSFHIKIGLRPGCRAELGFMEKYVGLHFLGGPILGDRELMIEKER